MNKRLEKSIGGASLYFYVTPSGINIIPEDPILGERTCLLNKSTDHRPTKERERPYVGERLNHYNIVDELTGRVEVIPSSWVVFHVEAFPGTGLVKEVVIAWCDKEK